jgi:hypothetical protein
VYDQITLWYDRFDPAGKVWTQLMITLPEVDETFLVKGTPKYGLSTMYNARTAAAGELMEIL